MPNLLEIKNLNAGYGNSTILENISFTLAPASSLALLGRNGMGKTTLLSTIMGVTNLFSGELFFKGINITKLPSYERANLGIGWVPQERDIFKSLTVEENLTVIERPGHWNLERVYEFFPRLRERRSNLGNQLSGGEQQMLAIGRALMLNPKLLLLDEPLEGLAPLIAQEILAKINQMKSQSDISIIIVEQHAHQILPISDESIVLERGQVVYGGPSQFLMDHTDQLEKLIGVNTH